MARIPIVDDGRSIGMLADRLVELEHEPVGPVSTRERIYLAIATDRQTRRNRHGKRTIKRGSKWIDVSSAEASF